MKDGITCYLWILVWGCDVLLVQFKQTYVLSSTELLDRIASVKKYVKSSKIKKASLMMRKMSIHLNGTPLRSGLGNRQNTNFRSGWNDISYRCVSWPITAKCNCIMCIMAIEVVSLQIRFGLLRRGRDKMRTCVFARFKVVSHCLHHKLISFKLLLCVTTRWEILLVASAKSRVTPKIKHTDDNTCRFFFRQLEIFNIRV